MNARPTINANEPGLLRRIVANLATHPVLPQQLTHAFLREHKMGRARAVGVNVVGLLRSGIEPFTELSETIFSA